MANNLVVAVLSNEMRTKWLLGAAELDKPDAKLQHMNKSPGTPV